MPVFAAQPEHHCTLAGQYSLVLGDVKNFCDYGCRIVDAIFFMTLRCGCSADVRITLVGPHLPSDETTYTLTEIGISDACI